MDELESRALKLARELADFGAELRLACAYTQVDPASSLTKSRIVMEKLLLDVYAREMGHEPRKPLLGDMLADNQFTRKIERRILSRMNAVRDMGNLGPHGETVEASDASRVLDDLCSILDWYIERNAHSRPALPVDAQAPVAAPQLEIRATDVTQLTALRQRPLKLSVAVLGASVLLLILLLVYGPQLKLWHSAPAPAAGLATHVDSKTATLSRDTGNTKRGVGDVQDLQGQWETVEVEADGEAVEKPLYKTMVIDGHRLNYYHDDGRPGNTFSFDLIPDKRPKRIDLFTSLSEIRMVGIYSLEGDVLKMCSIANPRDTNKLSRPDEFRTRPGSNLILITYKRK